MLVYEVMIISSLNQTFSYKNNAEPNLDLGDLVQVTFRNRKERGIIWNIADITEEKLSYQVKSIDFILYKNLLSTKLIEFISFAAYYNITTCGDILKMVISALGNNFEEVPNILYKLSDKNIELIQEKLNKKKSWQKVYTLLSDNKPRSKKEIMEHCSISHSVINNLIKKEFILPTAVYKNAQDITENNINLPTLLPNQVTALGQIEERLRQNGFTVVLIDGITGSGKTEVYFYIIKNTLLQNAHNQILVLLPEIILTTSVIEHFRNRFNIEPVMWHSSLSPKQREGNIISIISGKARLIIGARSALFLPYKNLSLIVIDEEHENSYKQEDNVIYHARDMAIARAKKENIPIILSSATPSIETYVNCEMGKYSKVSLKTRYSGIDLPSVNVIDINKDRAGKGKFISKTLQSEIINTVNEGKQVMLFLNRRGYAPIMYCTACHIKFKCPNCDVHLVEHRRTNNLHCHHCDYRMKIPFTCPHCNAENSLQSMWAGVERINEEIETFLSGKNISLITSDTVKTGKDVDFKIKEIIDGKIDIIIGTQILAKGLHFPALKLVGVIDADSGIFGQDFRSFEKTFQLLTQVAGRAGREQTLGKVYIQTTDPENKVLKAIANYDRDNFYRYEIQSRTNLPPFSRQILLIISSTNEDLSLLKSKEVAKKLSIYIAQNNYNVNVAGPTACQIKYLRRRYRFSILLRANRNVNMQHIVTSVISTIDFGKDLRIKIDVDPYSFV